MRLVAHHRDPAVVAPAPESLAAALGGKAATGDDDHAGSLTGRGARETRGAGLRPITCRTNSAAIGIAVSAMNQRSQAVDAFLSDQRSAGDDEG